MTYCLNPSLEQVRRKRWDCAWLFCVPNNSFSWEEEIGHVLGFDNSLSVLSTDIRKVFIYLSAKKIFCLWVLFLALACALCKTAFSFWRLQVEIPYSIMGLCLYHLCFVTIPPSLHTENLQESNFEKKAAENDRNKMSASLTVHCASEW